jgi:hypothetical protein
MSLAPPTQQQEDAAADTAAREVYTTAVTAIFDRLAAEDAERARRAKNKAEKLRWLGNKKRAAVRPPPPRKLPRLSRTFESSGATGGSSQARPSSAGKLKQKARLKIKPEHLKSISFICQKRRFLRHHIVGGELLGPKEWGPLQKDYLELRRVYAIGIYIRHRNLGMPSRNAYEEASKSVVHSDGRHTNWQMVRKWLWHFVERDAQQ